MAIVGPTPELCHLCEVLVDHEVVWLDHLFLDGASLTQLGRVCRTLHAWQSRDVLWEAVCTCHYPPRMLIDRLKTRRTAQDLERRYPVRCAWSSSPSVRIAEHGFGIRGVAAANSADAVAWIVGTPLSPSRTHIRLKVTKFDSSHYDRPIILIGVGTTTFTDSLVQCPFDHTGVDPLDYRCPLYSDSSFAAHAVWFASSGCICNPILRRYYNSESRQSVFDANDVVDIIFHPTISGVGMTFHINGTKIVSLPPRTLEKRTTIRDLRPVLRVPFDADLVFLPID